MGKADKIFEKLAEDYAHEGLLLGGLTAGATTAVHGVVTRKKQLKQMATNLNLKMVMKSPPKTVAEAEATAVKAYNAAKKNMKIALPISALAVGFMGAGMGGTLGSVINKKPLPRRKK